MMCLKTDTYRLTESSQIMINVEQWGITYWTYLPLHLSESLTIAKKIVLSRKRKIKTTLSWPTLSYFFFVFQKNYLMASNKIFLLIWTFKVELWCKNSKNYLFQGIMMKKNGLSKVWYRFKQFKNIFKTILTCFLRKGASLICCFF